MQGLPTGPRPPHHLLGQSEWLPQEMGRLDSSDHRCSSDEARPAARSHSQTVNVGRRRPFLPPLRKVIRPNRLQEAELTDLPVRDKRRGRGRTDAANLTQTRRVAPL